MVDVFWAQDVRLDGVLSGQVPSDYFTNYFAVGLRLRCIVQLHLQRKNTLFVKGSALRPLWKVIWYGLAVWLDVSNSTPA
jgi:hypothetical protein